MISVGMDDEARPTFGSVPNMAMCGLRFIPARKVSVGYISHILNKFS